MSDPTPEEIQRVHAFEQRQREEATARQRAENEKRLASARRSLVDRLVGRTIESVEPSGEVEITGPDDRWAETMGLVLTFADGGLVEIDGNYESSAITVSFLTRRAPEDA